MITHELKTESYKQHTDIALIILLDVVADTGTVYVTNNSEEVTWDGQVYAPVAFRFTLPDQRDDAPGSARLEIDNTSMILVQQVLENDEIDMRVRVVTNVAIDSGGGADIDETFKVENVEWNAMSIKAELVDDEYLFDRFPSGQFTPQHFRGIV